MRKFADEIKPVNVHLQVAEKVLEIIELMDDKAITALYTGSNADIDSVLNVLYQNTYDVFKLGKVDDSIIATTDHVPNLSESLNFAYKRLSYNYFKVAVLGDFVMQPHNIEWGNFVQLYNKLCIIAARGLGKSFEFDMAYPIWNMFRYEKDTVLKKQSTDIKMSKEGLSVTFNLDLARTMLRNIKDTIEGNDELRDALKPDGRDGWGKEAIETKKGSRWFIKSYGSTTRGLHLGRIVLDDFLSQAVLYSKEQNDKFIETFDSEIMNVLEPRGSIVVVGTPFSEFDLYAKLKKDKSWKVFEYPGILPDGRIQNPERFTYKYYMDMKNSIGTTVFSREILCKPISDDSSIFPYAYLQKAIINMQDITLVSDIQSYRIKFKRVVVGADFAISGTASADYSVFTVWGVDDLENFYLVHIWRKKGASHNEQVAQLVSIDANFRPNDIVCENNGFQRIMIELARERGMKNLHEFTTTGWNKKDLYAGLPSLAAMFERQQIRVPYGDENSKQIADTMFGEFNSIAFTDKGKLESVSDHDDIAMSTFLAIKGLKDKTNQVNVYYL